MSPVFVILNKCEPTRVAVFNINIQNFFSIDSFCSLQIYQNSGLVQVYSTTVHIAAHANNNNTKLDMSIDCPTHCARSMIKKGPNLHEI